MPEKKKFTQWRSARMAMERQMRETWALGLTRYSQLVIMRGRIRLIADHTGKIHTELWGSGVYLHLNWFADQLPPTLKDGQMATIIGNVHTFNLNTHVAVRNCLHIPKYGSQLGKEVRALMAKYVLLPKTYITEGQIDDLQELITAKERGRLHRKALQKK